MTLGISTLAFDGLSREEIVSLADKYGWLIEFSSGFPYQEDMAAFFKSVTIDRLAHNYFPAPKLPFVLNLASTDRAVRERSIKHCLQGLELTKSCGAQYFSAHAGFCIDPAPEQLGRQLDVNVPIERFKNWNHFLDSVRRILTKAEELGIHFLIENNVTSRKNLREDGQEVLLCSTPGELLSLTREIQNPLFGLLLDTGHLKVSAESLSFDKSRAVDQIQGEIRYIHHSDNSGLEDTNKPIGSDYWFLPWMRKFPEVIHILEVKNLTVQQIKSQLSLLDQHGK